MTTLERWYGNWFQFRSAGARSLDFWISYVRHAENQKVICDNGTEFTSKAMFFRGKQSNVSLGLIKPGEPTQNAFVEILNGKFMNECLNLHWFRTVEEARFEIDQWREHYNTVRPQSSLGYMPPVEFAEKAAKSMKISSGEWF